VAILEVTIGLAIQHSGSNPNVAKRPRFSRWRRLPPVFRSGEHRPIGTGNELDRIILYLPVRLLDLAEVLAEKAGIPALQDYCSQLLARALETEQIQQKVAEFEVRRGPLEGLKEIADDPDYLVEWQARSHERPEAKTSRGAESRPVDHSLNQPSAIETVTVDLVLADGDSPAMEPPIEGQVPGGEQTADGQRGPSVGAPEVDSGPVATAFSRPSAPAQESATSLEILWRHVGQGDDDWAFLPCLRRGVSVPAGEASELIRALGQLEMDHRGLDVLDRRLAHALHRLALESQVLLTDAWPGVFDEPMIAAIRAVQEAVERILSGQDIRYYPTAAPGVWEQPR
jgi:hypothetical protein